MSAAVLDRADRTAAVAMAAAHDLNDELTIILNAAAEMKQSLEPGHPARAGLAEIQSAVQRCVWKASGLLNYGGRKGGRPVAASFERVVSECE